MEDIDTSHYESFLRLQFPKFSKGYKPSDFNEFIEEHIGRDYVLSLGRLAFPNEWQMQISDNDAREKLIRMRKTKINNRSCWIFPLYFSEIRGFIHWLPNTVPNTKIEHFLRNYGRVQFVKNESQETAAGKVESGSRYFGLLLKPEYSKESLPHFLKLDGFTGLVNIWGRVSACFFCKEVGHQKVECVKFKEKLREYSQNPEKDSSARRKKPRGLRYVGSIPEENECIRTSDNLRAKCTTVQTKLASNLSEVAQMSSLVDTFEIESEAYFDLEVFQEFLEELKYILTEEVNRLHSCIKNSLLETASKADTVESVDIKTQEYHSLPTENPERTNQTPKNTMKIFFSTLKNKLEQMEMDDCLRIKIITLCDQFQIKYELKVAEKLDNSEPLLESVPSYNEVMQKIMERVANFENQNKQKITSIAVASELSETDMAAIISQLRNMCGKLREIITEKQREKIGPVIVPSQKNSTSKVEIEQKMMEVIFASEHRNIEKIKNCEKLSKAYQSAIIQQIKSLYAEQRKMIIENFSLVSNEIDTNAEAVEVSEFLKPIAERICNFMVPLENSSISINDFMQNAMEVIEYCEERSLKKLNLVAIKEHLNEEELSYKISQLCYCYTELRERVYEIFLQKTETRPRIASTERDKNSSASTEEGSVIVPLQGRSTSKDETQQEMMEIIAASENRILEKIGNCEKLGKAYQPTIIAQMKSLYAKQRKKTTDKFSLASTKIDTRAEKVEASEAVRSIAEKVEHFIVSLQKISISSDYFLERVMGRLAVSENRNLEKIALLATTTTELDTRVLLFRSIYEELRKRIIYNILLITKAYSGAEMISCSEVTRTLAEEIGSLIISLQERPISSADFAQEVMALITTSENQYLDKIASVASTSQINLIELISSTSKLRSIYKELRQTIIEILSQKATETGISEESEEVATAVAEEIGSLIVDLQDDSTTSHGSRQRHSERIAVFENQLLEKIMLMKVDGQPYEMKFALRLWQSRRTYESLRGNLKEFPTQGI